MYAPICTFYLFVSVLYSCVITSRIIFAVKWELLPWSTKALHFSLGQNIIMIVCKINNTYLGLLCQSTVEITEGKQVFHHFIMTKVIKRVIVWCVGEGSGHASSLPEEQSIARMKPFNNKINNCIHVVMLRSSCMVRPPVRVVRCKSSNFLPVFQKEQPHLVSPTRHSESRPSSVKLNVEIYFLCICTTVILNALTLLHYLSCWDVYIAT